MSDNNKPINVYYNSACPVCRAGIESQKGKMEDCQVNWKDVHADNALVGEVNAELEFVRERLHVVDTNGNIKVGFDAFWEIWRHSPKEHWLAKLLGLPVVRQIGSFIYNGFALVLYRWNRAKRHW
jgi:predicted DCC family thiol-disulfide oxidoreductase YuxK